jgi:hypothetical protein
VDARTRLDIQHEREAISRSDCRDRRLDTARWRSQTVCSACALSRSGREPVWTSLEAKRTLGMSNREIRESERTGSRRPLFSNSSRKKAEEEYEVGPALLLRCERVSDLCAFARPTVAAQQTRRIQNKSHLRSETLAAFSRQR